MDAVTGSVITDAFGIVNFVIVWINICFHIWHAAIAYLYGISVKFFMKHAVR